MRERDSDKDGVRNNMAQITKILYAIVRTLVFLLNEMRGHWKVWSRGETRQDRFLKG